MINNVNYALYMHDYRLNINHYAKISLDKRLRIGYNGFIKNGLGNQPNPFALKKEMELKKVLDKMFKLGYNEFIKNGIGSQLSLTLIDRKKR